MNMNSTGSWKLASERESRVWEKVSNCQPLRMETVKNMGGIFMRDLIKLE